MYKNHPKTIFWLTVGTLVFTPVLVNALDLSGIEPSTSPESDFINNSDVNALGSIQNILCSGFNPSEMASCMADLVDSNITAPQGVNPEVGSDTSAAFSGGGSGESSSGDSSDVTIPSTESATTPSSTPVVTMPTPTEHTLSTTPSTTETYAKEEATPVIETVPSSVTELAVVSVKPVPPTQTTTPAVVATVKKNTPKTAKAVKTVEVEKPVTLSPAAEVQPLATNHTYQANLLMAIPVVKANQTPAILTTLFLTFMALQVGFLTFCAIRNRR